MQPTWKKYRIMRAYVDRMPACDKRAVFHALSTAESPNEFLPSLGLTAGEFAVWQVFGESNRKRFPKK